jgi:hypothetical protein
VIKTLLDIKIEEIKSNERFTIYRCMDGKILMMGRDFKNKN